MTRIFLVAGEASGDALGAGLMQALRAARPDVEFAGVGGPAMERKGLVSLFPLADIAVMGLLPVLARLPRLLARIEETTQACVDFAPDALVIIDAPDFTHRVAKRVRRAAPGVPIMDYVSPTVWAWRPGRARAMRAYIDCVLALLPFEPAAHARLGGPRCVYVGHPLVEKLDELTQDARVSPPPCGEGQGEGVAEPLIDRATPHPDPPPQGGREPRPLLLVLPGSRIAAVKRMTPVYGEAIRLLLEKRPDLDVAIPVAPHVAAALHEALRSLPIAPRLISQEEKFAAFRNARAALVTSGAATLELALAGVPMAVAYKVSPLEWPLRHLITVDSIVLPNLILGERAVPELLQHEATPAALAARVAPLLDETPQRAAQCAAFSRLRAKLLEAGSNPSARAAQIVLAAIDGRP